MSREDTQFKPGQTGNPNGRPKKGNSWGDIIAEALSQEVSIGDDKKTIKEMIAHVLKKKALKGDLKAIEMIIDRQEGRPKQHFEGDLNVNENKLAEKLANIQIKEGGDNAGG